MKFFENWFAIPFIFTIVWAMANAGNTFSKSSNEKVSFFPVQFITKDTNRNNLIQPSLGTQAIKGRETKETKG